MRRPNHCQQRRGVAIVLVAFMLIGFLGITVLVSDIGYMRLTRIQLQNAADGAAMAAALAVADSSNEGKGQARQKAVDFALANIPHDGNVLKQKDITFGVWDIDSKTFTPQSNKPSAVRIVTQRSHANNNRLPLFFAGIFGVYETEVSATAIAALKPSEGYRLRFFLDEDVFDTDVEDIEELAAYEGMDPEDLIADNDNDGFIDIPPGSQLELPTGQVGDEGLVDIEEWNDFPFEEQSEYSTMDFLAEGTALEDSLGTKNLQDVEWKSSNAPHQELEGKKLLDPVPGMEPVSSHTTILNLPDPNQLYVSPVFKSDVSMAETDPSKYGSPAANLQGERRGLVAFKIISARSNPAGGSYLPLITIEILDPSDVNIEESYIGVPTETLSGSVSIVQ